MVNKRSRRYTAGVVIATHSPCRPRPRSLLALSAEESPGGQRVDARQPPRHGAVRPLPAPAQSRCHILLRPLNAKHSPKTQTPPSVFYTSNFFRSVVSEFQIQNNPKHRQRQKDVENRECFFLKVIWVIHSPQLLECPYYSRCTVDEPISSTGKMGSARLTDSRRHRRPLCDAAVVLKWRR